jgi:opacity protein-like surface antigen
MTMNKTLVHALVAGTLCAPAAALAQSPADPAPFSLGALYVLGAVGHASHDLDAGGVAGQLQGLGFRDPSVSTDDSDTAWRVGAGWQFHRNVALELSYFRLGEAGFSATAARPGEFSGNVRVTGWALDVVPQIRFANNWGVFGRVGYVRSESRGRFSGSGAFEVVESRRTERNNGWNAGLGVSYAFGANLEVRGEWTRFADLSDETLGGEFDSDVFWLSALWRFR